MMIRSLDTRLLKPEVERLCGISGRSARDELANFAAANGVALDRPV
jgi:hypothetical protein